MKKVIVSLTLAFCLVLLMGASGERKITVDAGGRLFVISENQIDYSLLEGYIRGLDEKIDFIRKSTYLKPRDAEIFFDEKKEQPFAITPEKQGAEIDSERLKRDILDALSVGGKYVKCKFKPVYPTVKAETLKKYTYLRGRFTTYFSEEQRERSQNIKLACAYLSGTRVEKGEVFSFNEAIGERSEERGFKSAKVIVDGEFTDGIGGGVCQVSTTLYNSALLSGLKVEEVHRHSLAVSYVEKSFDAMVSYGFADLKIRNVTDGPIFIKATAGEGFITLTFYGEEETRVFERESVVLEVKEPTVKTVLTDELGEGERRTVTYPKKGYKSEGYLIERKGDKVTRFLLRKDEYKAVDGVEEVGS